MPVVTKEIEILDDVRGLSPAAFFGIMTIDAAEQTTLIDCVMSLARNNSLRCNPEYKSVMIYNDQYSAVFEPDGELMSVSYTCRDEDYDAFITKSGKVVHTLMTSWETDDLVDFTYE